MYGHAIGYGLRLTLHNRIELTYISDKNKQKSYYIKIRQILVLNCFLQTYLRREKPRSNWSDKPETKSIAFTFYCIFV